MAAAQPLAPKQRFTVDDDPKRLIELDAKANQMLALYRAGKIDEAIAVGQEVIARRPDMDLAQMQIAYLERARGNMKGAISAAQRAVELRPGDPESAALLAVYLTEAGRAAAAARFLEPWLAREDDDLDVLNALAVALTSSGKPREALDVLARARRAYPTNTQVIVNIGTVYLTGGDLVHARQAFEAALDLDPGVARAHNSLGVIAAREGHMPEAFERWKRAVVLNPGDYQTLYNLGSELWQSGRREEARPYLEAYLREAPPALEARDIARSAKARPELLELLQRLARHRAHLPVRLQLDHLLEVRPGLGRLSLSQVAERAPVVGVRVGRIDPDRLSEVADRLGGVPVVEEVDAHVEEHVRAGDGALVELGQQRPRFVDHPALERGLGGDSADLLV